MGCALGSHKIRNSINSNSDLVKGGIIFSFKIKKIKKIKKTRPNENHLITIYEADPSKEYSFQS